MNLYNCTKAGTNEVIGKGFKLLIFVIYLGKPISRYILWGFFSYYRPSFRSYKPADEDLQDLAIPEPQIEEITDKVKDELENENKGVVMESLDFTNLAPKKPDWDLKRDIAPKLEKLEKRTQKAIAELIRERLKEEGLASAVSAGAAVNAASDDDD